MSGADPRVTVLEVKVDALEKRGEEHEKEDDRWHRYMSHLMEDLQAKLANLERTGVRFETDLTHRSMKDNGTEKSLNEIFARLRSLERMAWIAIGSTTAFGSMVVYFGKTITNMLIK